MRHPEEKTENARGGFEGGDGSKRRVENGGVGGPISASSPLVDVSEFPKKNTGFTTHFVLNRNEYRKECRASRAGFFFQPRKWNTRGLVLFLALYGGNRRGTENAERKNRENKERKLEPSPRNPSALSATAAGEKLILFPTHKQTPIICYCGQCNRNGPPMGRCLRQSRNPLVDPRPGPYLSTLPTPNVGGSSPSRCPPLTGCLNLPLLEHHPSEMAPWSVWRAMTPSFSIKIRCPPPRLAPNLAPHQLARRLVWSGRTTSGGGNDASLGERNSVPGSIKGLARLLAVRL